MITIAYKNYKQKNYLEFYHPHQIAIREILKNFQIKINKNVLQ